MAAGPAMRSIAVAGEARPGPPPAAPACGRPTDPAAFAGLFRGQIGLFTCYSDIAMTELQKSNKSFDRILTSPFVSNNIKCV